ncbi:MAG: matrixin family metalloprotease [Bdellovibrionales bacterium]|nr:matrixin family metalloprotease [Oligoflexia bacterium]
MKNLSFALHTIGYFSILMAAPLVAHDAHAFGRARAPASTPSPNVPAATPPPAATPRPTAAPTMTPAPVTTPTPAPISSTCVSSDPAHLCMGIKMVSYTKNDSPVLSESQANALIAGINKAWSPCNIAFQLEKYEAVDPATRGLNFDSNWRYDGDTIRSNFNDGNTFLVVSVGNLTGSTIAVTQMPGTGVYGVLVENNYANNPLTVGHELGHYMGLYHVNDTSNLMSAYIGPNTAAVNADQCATARKTDFDYWQVMMRH